MNVMKKWLVSGAKSGTSEESENRNSQVIQQHLALSLMHLKKLFSEFSYPTHPLSDAEKEYKLYNMLPLFCKVFGSSPADMHEKFADILLFTMQVSKLMVSEIRRRAANQSTEAASCAIIKFLRSEGEESSGWVLLQTLNILAAGPQKLIEVMTSTSLPSTLVKCLYLFFDLPLSVAQIEQSADKDEQSPLQKAFLQLLINLCSHVGPAEELARKDDLRLLFIAITSWCASHNVIWRKSAAEVLMTLSRHGLSQPIVNYIHNKGFVALCVENLERSQDITPIEVVEMFVTVFCFLKDSSDVSQTLLDDFRSVQGYTFLTDFILKLEQNLTTENDEALRNIVLLVSSLSYCGYNELKPSTASVNSPFQLPGFSLPYPAGRGASVKNLQAFNVLHNVFLRGNSESLCTVVLDAISAVYHADSANFFILEPLSTLSTFAERIHTKPSSVQLKFFNLLETVVFQLNFVPCKELVSLSLLLKAEYNLKCSTICLNTLLNILKYNVLFKEVYREVGILEILVIRCLARYQKVMLEEEFSEHSSLESASKERISIPFNSADFSDSQAQSNKSPTKIATSPTETATSPEKRNECNEIKKQLGILTIEALTILLSNNSKNSNVFRESKGNRFIMSLVANVEFRPPALGLLQQLILSSGCDEDMGSILSLLHTARLTELQLKIDILRTLLVCLKESHRTRTVFRKVGGFVYLISVIVGLEGTMGDQLPVLWADTDPKLILNLLVTVFTTLTTAMRYEPANAKFFHQEFCPNNLCNALKMLNCFSSQTHITNSDDSPWKELLTQTEGKKTAGSIMTFHEIFTTPVVEYSPPFEIPLSLVRVTQLYQLLYHMALDAFDKPTPPNFYLPNIKSAESKFGDYSPGGTRRPSTGLHLGPPPVEPTIVHPGVVMTMLHLIPAIYHSKEVSTSAVLQLYAAHLIKSLVRNEKNQQVMCEANLGSELLELCVKALMQEDHPLHPILQYMFERLAAQAILPSDLRTFLRLGDPLNCKNIDELEVGESPRNGPVPLSRVKTIVSMATAKDSKTGPPIYPAFVEFDLNSEGFACLFLPSIAPQSVGTGSVVPASLISAEVNVIGGIGSGDRVFPPQTGLTYSTWFCVDKFSDPRTDPHSVRLLTIARHVPGKPPLTCLSINVSARDKALIISTNETALPLPGQGVNEWEPQVVGDFGVRVWSPDLLSEGQWHHLVLSLNRAVLKNSSCSLYIDGKLIQQKKLNYISQNPGGGAANLNVASSVFGYVGTPPAYRRHSRLVWKQGPCHLFEDVLQQSTVSALYCLGPHYTGCLQAPKILAFDGTIPLIPEEKVVFSLNSTAMSYLTLHKISKVYSKVDNKAIAKQLGMSSHENATPIRILHNAAGHLNGGSRTLGGVVLGYLGVRAFCPRPFPTMIQTVGGCGILLGLVAMSSELEHLYAAVKSLSCVIKTSKLAEFEMERLGGYQTLSLLFKKKKLLLSSQILQLCIGLVVTGDSKQVSTSISNEKAFSDLLCQLDIWIDDNDLLKTLLDHFVELFTESSDRIKNVNILRNLNLVSKLLHEIYNYYKKKDGGIISPTSSPISKDFVFRVNDGPSSGTIGVAFTLLGILLMGNPRPQDLLLFGQFIVSTLPISCGSEKTVELSDCRQDIQYLSVSARNVLLRNRCLEIIHTLLYNSNKNTINLGFCEKVCKFLGLDWVVLFTQGHLHSTTVLISLKMLVALLSNNGILSKFREASQNGGWLSNAHLVNDLRQPQMSGMTIKFASEVKEDVCHVPGFQILTWQISSHTQLPELYYLLLALLLGHPVKNVQKSKNFDLDSIWIYLFGIPVSKSSKISGLVSLCPEATVTILAMIRAMLNQHDRGKELPEWLRTYPATLIEFLHFLYKQNTEFLPVFLSPEVLTAFAETLFPYASGSEPATLFSPLKTPKSFDDILIIDTDRHLTSHPAKVEVMQFLKTLVFDSLSLPPNSKGPQVIDYILEANPDQGGVTHVCEFQTHLLGLIMDHLLDADILIGEAAAISLLAGGATQYVATNVFYITGRIVDKMWTGMFLKDAHEVFDFIIKLITQAKRRSISINLEFIFHSLNRTILYLLSRPVEGISSQMSILETLHKLTNHRSIVFGAGNHELEFLGCLTFCLLQLTSDLEIMTDVKCQTIWHINPEVFSPGTIPAPSSGESGFANFGNTTSDSDNARAIATQGHNLMRTAAVRVWEELYITKKPAIEEVFKVTLAASSGKAPDLNSVREMVYENSMKVWFTFLENEKKQSYKHPWEMPVQFQSVTNKIQKVTEGLSGLTRLASRNKYRRDETIVTKKVNLPMTEVQLANLAHIGIVKDVITLHFKNLLRKRDELYSYAEKRWHDQEKLLTRECGLFGPTKGSILDKWVLQATEGPLRMRKKVCRNFKFYSHYPFRPTKETESQQRQKYKLAACLQSEEYLRKKRTEGLSCMEQESEIVDDFIEDREFEASIFVGKEVSEMDVTALKGTCTSVTETEEENESIDILDVIGSQETDTVLDEENPDEQTLHRLLEDGETATHIFRCARIEGLDMIEGLLIFGKEHFYIVDNFTILKNREVRFIGSLPPGVHEPIIPGTTAPPASTELNSSKFHYDDIREVHQRRYLLQPIAIELFSSDGRNYLLSLPKKQRNKVFQRLMVVCTGLSDSAHQSVEGQRRSASVEQGGGLFSSIIGETSVTHRWVRGEISNFQYLMHLNTLAGRSYNDLMQYPVFPWVLRDFESNYLDLNSSESFRDFSKPMGAQTLDRLGQFRKRYREWEDPTGETPPYHYGTHYSSAMIVSSYLVRMEPFTQHFLRLQGGHFDLPDRMFHSMKDAWNSAAKNNMADVKELIPEFFYLPEFLLNENKFEFGFKQNGTPLDDVILPPWAKNDPREFIRLHRAALECDYVSSHLHEWIDLIFGFKQRGSAAVEAVNVFHYLFYEGNVDIYNIDDPLKKTATIGFINNFGQIPKQLFKKPHPCKKINGQRSSIMDSPLSTFSLTSREKVFYHNLENLKPSIHPIKEVKGAVGHIIGLDRNVLAVEHNKVLIPNTFQRYLAWGFADHSLKIGSYETDKALLVYEKNEPGEVLAAVCPNVKTVITAGTSTVVTVYSIVKRQLKQKAALYGHADAVTCLAASSAFGLLVSGSRDRSAIIWDLSSLSFVRQLIPHQAPLAAVAINEQTGDIATCAGTWLQLWSINGTPLASVNTALGAKSISQQILCVTFSTMYDWDPDNVILTGSSDGITRMWSLEYVQVVEEEVADETSFVTQKSKSSTEETSPEDTILKLPSIETRRKSTVDSKKLLTANEEFNTGGLLVTGINDSSIDEEEPPESDPDESEKDDNELDTFVNIPRIKKVSSQISCEESLTIMKTPKTPSVDATDVIDKKFRSRQPTLSSSSLKDVESNQSLGSPDLSIHKVLSPPDVVLNRTKSAIETGDSSESKLSESKILTSKSDTNLVDSFVLVSEEEILSADNVGVGKSVGGTPAISPHHELPLSSKNLLQPGMKWGRHLVFRRKLTMHTAYDRKDNSEPSAVTAIAVSKDHRTVYVGDARGRVFSWNISESPSRGGLADHWQKDTENDQCTACSMRFSVYERKHHCRNCGHIYCYKCSRFEAEISRLKIFKPVRVCQKCYQQLKSDSN